MQAPTAISAVLSILSLVFSCVMLAGSSDNCDVLKHVSWSKDDAYYMGTRGVCAGNNYTKFNSGPCSDSGKIATGFTALMFILTVMITAISMVRLNATSTAGGLMKVASISLPIVAIIADIIAIAHFDDTCLSEPEWDTFDPSVGIIMGSIAVFFLLFITILHAVAK